MHYATTLLWILNLLWQKSGDNCGLNDEMFRLPTQWFKPFFFFFTRVPRAVHFRAVRSDWYDTGRATAPSVGSVCVWVASGVWQHKGSWNTSHPAGGQTLAYLQPGLLVDNGCKLFSQTPKPCPGLPYLPSEPLWPIGDSIQQLYITIRVTPSTGSGRECICYSHWFLVSYGERPPRMTQPASTQQPPVTSP